VKEKYSITYDFGTSSVKAALIDENYDVAAWCTAPYKMYYPEPGFAVQKVEDYRNSFCSVTKRLLKEAGISGGQIKGAAISTTSCTMIFIDEHGLPMNDCVTWIDNRAVSEADILNKQCGKDNWTQGKRIPAKIKWFVDNRPDIVEKAEYLVDLSGYLFMILTGRTAFEWTVAISYDLTKPGLMEWDYGTVDITGMPRSLLPERIIASYEKAGEMIPGFAEEAGFVPGTPVFGACSDNANGHLGAGCIRPGDAHLYLGSSGWISVSAAMPENLGKRNVMQSAMPGIGYDYYCTNSVGTSIDYLISEFYKKESEDPNIDIYKLVSDEALSVENDHQDTIFMPFLFGEEEPVMDHAVRASLLNIKSTTTRAHIARAVMEGIAFNFRWIKEKLAEQGAWDVNFLRVIGGCAQSDVFMQILADIISEKLVRLKSARVAGNIGLAACIDIGLGAAKDFTVLDECVKEDRTFVPRPEFKEWADRLFAVYKDSYSALKSVYDKINLE